MPNGLTNVLSVAAGYDFSLALLTDGTVVGWGNDGTLLTNLPSSLNGIVAIAAGHAHSLALKADGTVIAWGDNSSGQTNVPAGLKPSIAVACGNGHSVALQADGTVAAWGADFAGQTDVPPGLSNVVAIAAGGWNSAALRADGTVLEWGTGSDGETQVPTDLNQVVAISVGAENSVALKADGTLVNWGFNGYGLASPPSAATNVVAIASGEFHTLALRQDGMVVAWGENPYGQLNVPGTLSNVVAVAAGASDSLAVQNQGTPWIARQPLNQAAYTGTTVQLTAGVVGLPTLRSVWQRDGTNFAFAANGTLTLTNVQLTDSGVYRVTVTNSSGSVTSSNATLTVLTSAPFIITGLTNQTIFGGSNVTFVVYANGSQPMAYQWQLNGQAIPGALSSSLNLTNIQWTDAGSYSVVVSNSFGAATNSAQLTLLPLVINGQPQNQTVLAGGSATFAAIAIGAEPFQFLWQFNGTGLPGATANPLVLTNVQPTQAGLYSVAISNAFGGAFSSNALLTVLPFRITNQPQSQFALLGSMLSLKVGATGQGPFTYQWQKGGNDLEGETNSSLVLTNAQVGDSGTYSAQVSNDYGTVTSSNANVAISVVAVWGNNTYGQTNVPIPATTNTVQLAAGDSHSIALRADGTVVSWGTSLPDQATVLPTLTNIVEIAAGSSHGLAVRQDGTVALWGSLLRTGKVVPSNVTNVIAMALGPGAQHAIALRADGTVVDWGYPNCTNVPPAANHLVSVAAGAFHSAALRSDGRVIAWGDNGFGQLNIPSSATNIVAISAGWYHTAALRSNGTVVTWGSGPGQPPVSATGIVEVASGGNHALALKRDGTLVVWGDNGYGQGVVPKFATNLATIAGGSYDSLAEVAFGPPIFPGVPANRIADDGTTAYFRVRPIGALPMSFQWLCDGTNVPGATNLVLALTNVQPSLAGSLYSLTASNRFGLATSLPMTLSDEPLELAIQATNLLNVVGANITLSAAALGQGPFGYQWQLDGTNLDWGTSVTLTLTNAQLSAAGTYSVIVTNTFGSRTQSVSVSVLPTIVLARPSNQTAFPGGTALFSLNLQAVIPVGYQWLFNGADLDGATNKSLALTNVQYSQAGTYSIVFRDAYETVTNSASLAVVPIASWGDMGQALVAPGLTNLIAIASGESHALALNEDGTILGWGNNYQGQATAPPQLTNVISIGAGNSHSLALSRDGTVFAWGFNLYGETNVPVGLSNVVAISAGDYHNLALKADGTVVAWGNNSQGQTNVPANLSNVVAIAAGEWNSMALQWDGTVVAWGAGKLNTGTDPNWGQSMVPSGLSNVIQIATGGPDDSVLTGDGRVLGWGGNFYGENNTPAGTTNIVSIASGYGHSLALAADGTVRAWGYNYYGQSTIPAGLQNVSSLAAKGFHSLALVSSGPPTLRVPIAEMSAGPGNMNLSFTSQSGRVYTLESTDSLVSSNWTLLSRTAGTGGTLTISDSTATNAPQRFYRIRQW